MVFKKCWENNCDIYIWERVTGLRQKLHSRTVLFSMLSLGDDKYYFTSLPRLFRVLIPRPLQIISAVELAPWMSFYRLPFIMIFSLIFVFETLKKSVLCQGKVSAVGTAAQAQDGRELFCLGPPSWSWCRYPQLVWSLDLPLLAVPGS